MSSWALAFVIAMAVNLGACCRQSVDVNRTARARPGFARIGGVMRQSFLAVAAQGAMQVATIAIIALSCQTTYACRRRACPGGPDS
jgi:hypothetical protein